MRRTKIRHEELIQKFASCIASGTVDFFSAHSILNRVPVRMFNVLIAIGEDASAYQILEKMVKNADSDLATTEGNARYDLAQVKFTYILFMRLNRIE